MKIISITTANPGWFAVFNGKNGEIKNHVAVWAVVEQDYTGITRVTGFCEDDKFDTPADDIKNFSHWEYDNET